MKNIDAKNHVTGRSIYLDDIPVQTGTLYALAYDAQIAHAKIKSIDYTKARLLNGVERILTYKDIKGENQIGGIFPDEPLLAENEVHFWGMPIALIIAESEFIARQAKKLIEVDYEELPVITDPRDAKEKDSLIFPPRTFQLGDTKSNWDNCAYIFEGEADSGGQEHLYIETHGAYAYPTEHGSIRISSSTQGPTQVQKQVARVLGVPMHKIEIDVTRLGGGFGGKEDQATVWGVFCAFAAQILNCPIKYSVHRMDDMRMTGKRHPYRSDYKIGLSKDLKIIAYQATFHQNAGASADLSPAVMERTLFHATNTYYIPNVEVTAYSCKTHLPPNTAFRGFGGPQGMFVIESALVHAATELGISPREIQEKNLVKNGDEFSYGQVINHCLAQSSWNDAIKTFQVNQLEKEITAFNAKSTRYKKGLAIMPICFGISFTNTPMNHARALCHIYQDGSIGVSTGGIEMGQGLNTKMVQIVQEAFSIDADKIKLESTNTTRVANTSPTAASAGADLNGKALEIACNALLNRLKEGASNFLNTSIESIQLKNEFVYVNDSKTEMSWENLIEYAFLNRIALTENGHYSTPLIHFDKSKEKGHPFAYHVYGTSIHTVTVDCMKGTYEFDAVKIVHDFGKSMNTDIDNGQIEGALVQGMGWMTMEELIYNKKGKLMSNALSTYKIPDIYSVPKIVEIKHLDTEGHPLAIKKSKAVGEPPLMYGIGSYFAIQNAVKTFNPKYKLKYNSPFTPEKVLMALYEK